MTTEENAIRLLAEGFTNNTVKEILEYCTEDVKYISSGVEKASGRADVDAFLEVRRSACEKKKPYMRGFYGNIENTTVPGLRNGQPCAVLTQMDPYNITGYMTVRLNEQMEITCLDFHTDPETEFSFDGLKGHEVISVPKDAHDGIGYLALGYGIMDEHVDLRRHVQRYEIFQEYVEQLYQYVMHTPFPNFMDALTTAAGYMYCTAMMVAVNRRIPDTFEITFDPKDAIAGVRPEKVGRWKKWLNEGYETGKKLFLAFPEYWTLRSPGEKELEEQMWQSFMDMCFYGSTQANRDMDQMLSF